MPVSKMHREGLHRFLGGNAKDIIQVRCMKKKTAYLRYHNQAKGQTKQDHIDAIHPPQKDKV